MRKSLTLTAKLALIGSTCLVLALASIGLTLWVTWKLEGGAAAVNEAGRMRMQIWRLAQSLQATGPDKAQAYARRFDESIELLRSGDPSRPLFVPWDASSRTEFADIETRWRGLRASWLAPSPPPPAEAAAQAERVVDSVDVFVSAIEHQLSRWTSILNLVQFSMMALAICGAVVFVFAGYLFVLDPITRLRFGLRRIEGGDLAARVHVESRDEFGELSDGFNSMAQTLESLYQGLEDKVREKTASLEIKQQRLAALYEASAFLARANTLEELAPGFVLQMRRAANADAAVIRWSDEANERHVLMAEDGLPEAMAADEHCLVTGSCFCGIAQNDAATRVVPIRAETNVPLAHCARAGYQTLVTVPVLLQQRLLGEIDLFFHRVISLQDEERALLDAMASHLASAMEGLRANALEREAAVAEERGLLARELHDSIAQSLAFLKIQVQLLRGALARGDANAVEQTIGELDAGLQESTSDVRELLLNFRTRTNAEDIEPALRSTLQKFELQSGIRAHLDLIGHGLPLEADVQIQVLHVLQEALSNVRKHARANEVWLEVQRTPYWRFEVRDDGCGFDVTNTGSDETHVGLRIMRERAARIGARVEVDSVVGAGTCVVLDLPAASARPAAPEALSM
jgi:two-component system nitrate/nitrite sensor histidine kinase NarX